MQVRRLGAHVFVGADDGGSANAMRREIRLAWLGGGLPFLAALVILLHPSDGLVASLTELRPAAVAGGFFEAEVGVDRRGEHLAFLTADGAVHRVRIENGIVRISSLSTDCGPFLPTDISSLRWADVTGDGLAEAVIGGSNDSLLGPEQSCVLRPEARRWIPQDTVPRLALTLSEPNLHELFAGGRALSLWPLCRPGRDDQRTKVTDLEAGRIIARLEGHVRRICDFDGNGSEDLLTWADGDGGGSALVRLYVVRGRRFVCVWEQPIEYGDAVGRTGPYVECADLDRDGGAELYVFEPLARRVRAWRWDEPAADHVAESEAVL